MKKEQLITTYRYVLQRYALDRFEDDAIKSLQTYYSRAKKQVEKDIAKAIKNNRNIPERKRLQALYKEIDTILSDLSLKITTPASKAIGEAGAYSYDNTAAILSWDGKVEGFNNVGLTSGAIANLVTTEKLGDYDLDGWLFNAVGDKASLIKANINAAKIRGVGYNKLMRELSSEYSNLLSDNKVKDNVETVVKSYIQSVNAKAHKDLYEANRNVIEEVEWSAIMENGNAATGRGTCPRCMALDGQTFPSVSRGPNCPLHPRCRCMYVPVAKTWEQLGFGVEERETLDKKWYERARNYSNDDINKPNKAMSRGLTDKNYPEYWKTKPLWWQDNAIGPVRANLVRDGVVKFQDIIYKNGNLIPLNQLVGKEALTEARKHRR